MLVPTPCCRARTAGYHRDQNLNGLGRPASRAPCGTWGSIVDTLYLRSEAVTFDFDRAKSAADALAGALLGQSVCMSWYDRELIARPPRTSASATTTRARCRGTSTTRRAAALS
jgi:hypothetical protein